MCMYVYANANIDLDDQSDVVVVVVVIGTDRGWRRCILSLVLFRSGPLPPPPPPPNFALRISHLSF